MSTPRLLPSSRISQQARGSFAGVFGGSPSAPAAASVQPAYLLASMLRSVAGGDTGPMSVEPQGVPLRMVIVDDNGHFLEAARTVLEDDGIDVVGMARTSAQALRLAAALEPDVILVDVDLGGESGLDLAQQLAASENAADRADLRLSGV